MSKVAGEYEAIMDVLDGAVDALDLSEVSSALRAAGSDLTQDLVAQRLRSLEERFEAVCSEPDDGFLSLEDLTGARWGNHPPPGGGGVERRVAKKRPHGAVGPEK
ncbi:hypothetical protein ACWGKU_39420, partial [Kitasatospora sp. NPDC054768]